MNATASVYPAEKPSVSWWLVLIQGIASIILGLLLLIKPGVTTVVLIQLLGIYWFIAGILSIVSIFTDQAMWGWKLFSGILGIIAGILIIQHPLWSTLLVPPIFIIVLGVWGLVIGVIYLIQAFRGGGWGIGVLGALSIILGLLLLARPFFAALTLPWVLGIFGVIGGILALFGAFRVKREWDAYNAGAKAATSAGTATAGAAAVNIAEKAGTMAVEAGEGTGAVSEAGEMAGMGAVSAAAADTAEKAGETTEGAVTDAAAVVESVEDKLQAFLSANPEVSTKFNSNLEYIEGIGPVFRQKLNDIGIITLLDLLKNGALPKGRAEIAEKSGISGKLILEWVNHVDLYRIKGVGSEYADLLEAAGVDTVVELAMRNPVNLFEKMIAVNEEKNLVRRTPVQSQVQEWVDQAKQLPRIINY